MPALAEAEAEAEALVFRVRVWRLLCARPARGQPLERLERVRQLGGAVRGQLLLLEAASPAQKAAVVKHVQAARLQRPVGACLLFVAVKVGVGVGVGVGLVG